jgi:hypothetical protein
MGTQNRMVVDEFSAPNLVGQALFGALLVRIFGQSFFILRLSTILLSCGLACLIWYLLRKVGVHSCVAWIATLSWVFNPIQFCLSFTFMTELPFLFLVGAATAQFVQHLDTGRIRPLLICAAILGYAYLIRQTAAFFMVAVAFCLLTGKGEQSAGRRSTHLAIWAGAEGVFLAAWGLWVLHHGGTTVAARRKFELLRYLSAEQVTGNSLGQLFYLSFFLLPVLVYMLPDLKGQFARVSWKTGMPVVAAWISIPLAGLWWFHKRFSHGPYLPARAFHGQMPFLLNILYDTGLGPVTLDPTYYGPPTAPVHPGIWLGVTWLAAAGASVLGLLLTFEAIARRRQPVRPDRRAMLLYAEISLLVVILFEVAFSHLQEGGLFDRHILTAALPLIILAGLVSRDTEDGNLDPRRQNPSPAAASPAPRTGHAVAAALLLAAFAWFSVTATHDYLAWNRVRWELGSELLAQKVDPLLISGGFEFNGWNNYDTFRARGNIGRVFYWWYDRPDYLITMTPQENYHQLKKLEYFSWLHRKNLPLYLLRRD